MARDLSESAIIRLEREALRLGVEVDAGVADMREVGRHVEGRFDVVISFDNSIPHLLTDGEIIETLRGLVSLLAPDGVVLLSLRDYDVVARSAKSYHPYGERVRDGRRFRLGQEWEWYDESHYRTTLVIEEWVSGTWREVLRSGTAYYAIGIDRLIQLMARAGLSSSRVSEPSFFQPVLFGRC